MSDQTIPEQIAQIMTGVEIENMKALDGWAVGDVVETNERGQVVNTYEDAWAELFNGAGRAGEFGGVRFMSVDGGDYHEAYAYPSEETADGNHPCYYVIEWIEPEEPAVGRQYPDGPGVTR